MSAPYTQDKIKVMQAWTEGKKIDLRSHLNTEWVPLTDPNPTWDWSTCDFRVQPEPMEIRVWCKNGVAIALHSNFRPVEESHYTLKTFVEKV